MSEKQVNNLIEALKLKQWYGVLRIIKSDFLHLHIKSRNMLPSLWVSFLSNSYSLWLTFPSQFVNKKHLSISLMQLFNSQTNFHFWGINIELWSMCAVLINMLSLVN